MMAVGALPQEYITHRVTSGDVIPYDMNLTATAGISALVLASISQDGRLWGEVVGTTLTLYKRVDSDGTLNAADGIASGAVAANGETPLTELNSSTVTGKFWIEGTGKFDIIFSYCEESDLNKYIFGGKGNRLYLAIQNDLDPTKRYDQALRESKEDLDRDLLNAMVKTPEKFVLTGTDATVTDPFPLDSTGRYQMATMSAPKQLRRLHVYKTIVHLCNEVLLNFPDVQDICERFEKLYDKELSQVRLSVDYEGDMEIDETNIENTPPTLDRA